MTAGGGPQQQEEDWGAKLVHVEVVENDNVTSASTVTPRARRSSRDVGSRNKNFVTGRVNLCVRYVFQIFAF